MKKRHYIFLSLALFLTLAISAWKLSSARSYQLFGEIIPRVETSERVVALTFDDGPTPAPTHELLSILGQEQVKATFFVIGAELEQHPELGKLIVSEGHELGNHSYSHERMVLKSPSFIRDEIERTDRLIHETGQEGSILFRPPYGKKLVLLPYYLSRQNRKTIMWDIEPDSYPEIAGESNRIVEYVLERTRPGSIILLHTMYGGREPSLQAVKGIIEGLKKQGYEFKKVSELLSIR